VKFDVGTLMKNLSRKSTVKIGQKYLAYYVKTKLHFIVAGGIKSP
jgi:hypothetical protein